MGQSVSTARATTGLLLAAACLGACTSQELDESQVLTPGKTRPATGTLTAAQTTLGGASHAEYRSTSDARRMVIIRPEPSAGKPWTVMRSEAEGQAEPQIATELVFAMAGGEQVLVETTEHADKVVTEMKPPMLVFPATLEAGKPDKREFQMIVHPVGNSKVVKNEGPTSVEMIYESDETLAVPAGTFETHKV